MNRKLLWAVLAIGLALVIAPLALGLPGKAAAGQRMLNGFQAIMQPDQVTTTARYYNDVFVPLGTVTPMMSAQNLAKFQAYLKGFAGMQTDDPRFLLTQRSRADLDLLSYRKGRVNFLVDTELLMGSERRAFDLNHANIVFETSSSYRVGPIDVAAVVHHVSRHVVDREFDRVPAWHTVGARGAHLFLMRQSTIDVSLEYGRVVQHTFVDYTWTSQGTIRLDQTLRPDAHVFASGSGGLVGVDRAVVNRGRQTGARAEGGVRFVAERGAVDFFGAYEQRVDGYPTSRQPSSWFEFGVRLGTP